MARYEELKQDLGATVFYAKQIGEKLKNPDIGQAERADLESELEAVETKAEGLAAEAEKQKKVDDRELRIKSIGRDMAVQDPTEDPEPQVRYRDPVEMFLKSENFEGFRQDIKDGKRDVRSEPVEFKAAPFDVTSDQAGDVVTSFIPGVTNLNYSFPNDVGARFTQGTMTGSGLFYVVLPTGATADADYQTIGQQKGGTFVATLDSASETAKTVGAVALIPSQNLDDIDGLEGEVRSILLVGPNGLGEMLEDAYINGAGGSSEIQGILTLSPDDSTLVGDYPSKSVFKAAADIKAATGFTADTVVVHPDDWYILSTEVGTEDNRPLFGPWGTGWGQNGVGPDLVISRKIESGTALVGAFKASTRYVRSGVQVYADQAGLGLRDKNLVLFVAEAREMLIHRYGKDPYRTVTIAS